MYQVYEYTKLELVLISHLKRSASFTKITTHTTIMCLRRIFSNFLFQGKGKRNFQLMCFQNLAPLEEFSGQMIYKTIWEIYHFIFDKDVE